MLITSLPKVLLYCGIWFFKLDSSPSTLQKVRMREKGCEVCLIYYKRALVKVGGPPNFVHILFYYLRILEDLPIKCLANV